MLLLIFFSLLIPEVAGHRSSVLSALLLKVHIGKFIFSRYSFDDWQAQSPKSSPSLPI